MAYALSCVCGQPQTYSDKSGDSKFHGSLTICEVYQQILRRTRLFDNIPSSSPSKHVLQRIPHSEMSTIFRYILRWKVFESGRKVILANISFQCQLPLDMVRNCVQHLRRKRLEIMAVQALWIDIRNSQFINALSLGKYYNKVIIC